LGWWLDEFRTLEWQKIGFEMEIFEKNNEYVLQ